jgi:hypothetical protein
MPRSVPAACLLALALGVQARAAGPYDDLLRYAPPDTNVIALVDVKAALNSPLAKKENWTEKARAGGRGALGFIPPDAEQVVVAAEVNLSRVTRDFQLALVRVRNVPSTQQLINIEGGTTDEIRGRLVVLSPRDVYFTTLSGSELAAIYPADRQSTARWLRAVRNAKGPALSPYLTRAADGAAGNAVTVAVDLEDVVDKTILKMALGASPTIVRQKDVNVGTLAGFLASVRGLTFTAKIGEAITGNISVEFPLDPDVFRRVLPGLMLELLDGEGVSIPGMDRWEVKFADRTMTMTGPMTTADLKHVLSLFAFPQAGGDESAAKGEQVSVPATKRYLAAVDSILTDVSGMKDSPNYTKTATWQEKAAAQIEHVSRRGVDPVAVDAALQSAKRLRAIGASLRGVPIDLKALESQQYYYATPNVGVMPGGWWGWKPFLYGGNNVSTNIPKIQEQMSQVIAEDQKRRNDAWSQITRLMADAKTKLADKYKTPF